jgi:hypothetical protein
MSHDEHDPGEPEFGEHADEPAHGRGERRSGGSEGEEKPREATDPSTFSPERAPDDAGA